MLVFAIIVVSLFIYFLMVVLSKSLCDNTTEWDEEESWCIAAFWPITMLFWSAYVVAVLIMGSIKNRFNEAAKEEKRIKSKYKSILIPKIEIDDLKDYRRLSETFDLLRNKLKDYEIKNNIPITERSE